MPASAQDIGPPMAGGRASLADLGHARGSRPGDIAAAPPGLAAASARLHALGLSHLRAGRPGEAARILRRLVREAPDSVEAHGNLANALLALGELDKAAHSYRTALALAPDMAETHNNLATVLWQLGERDAALEHFRTAIALAPTYAAALNNLGLALQQLNRHVEAIAAWRKAQAVMPGYAEAHWNEALARLALGEYTLGWRKYEWRWRTRSTGLVARQNLGRLWLGDAPLAGKSVLLTAEQGLGDTLQFVRYAPLLALRGARVMIEAQPALVPLLRRLPGVARLLAQGEVLPQTDFHCPLLSLPLVFGTTLETIPDRVPYLTADPAKVARWKLRLNHLSGLHIGLAWAGAKRPAMPLDHDVDGRRSITLAHFAPLAGLAGAQFVSLQKGAAAAQTRTPPRGLVVHDWTGELHDFDDTAALIAALDLVISVDTSVVHAAGALAKPTWLLNRFDSCWRWLVARNDSPWYPTLRQFRQERPGDWEAVMRAMRRALAEYL